MTSATCTVNLPVALLLAMAANSTVEANDTLTITADAPVVSLSLRYPGRTQLRLPTLEYQFEIRVHCTANRSPQSLSLNVADTRKSLTADEIVANGSMGIRLSVPASQIAPLVIEGFCVAPDGTDGGRDDASPDRLIVPSALSAQASLLCEGDADKAMTYVSQPLDVSLVCEREAEHEDSDADRNLIGGH